MQVAIHAANFSRPSRPCLIIRYLTRKAYLIPRYISPKQALCTQPPHCRFCVAGRMKLLTHNMLSCHIKNVRNGYPFLIEVVKVSEHEADFDPGKLLVRAANRGFARAT